MKDKRIPQYKLTVVGDGGSGKTSLLSVFTKDYFPEKHNPTVFDTMIVPINCAGQQAQLELWDTAGQEDYDRLRPMSYPDTHVILLVFSISNPDSLVNAVEKWLPEVHDHCPNVPIILVGTKRDLRNDPKVIEKLAKSSQTPVTQASAKGVSEGMKSVKAYMECSSKQREGVREIFDIATRFAMAQDGRKTCCTCSCTIV
ncbi:Ras-like GTP-binding protein Rho1 [Hypsibius exemplaris]|uniref:Ras-like GTP-binding protein Rho1 n=1 Tax=Hypsibius exemplaris TaxID=2072580 RepID=A0A9X6RKW7_HYPEX|nr:Ras-like GTP-binding protein Rho1 [Hypsibius exemplaris]